MRGLRNVGAPRLTWILLGLMSVAAAAVVVILGLRLSFFNDEWYVLLQRPGLSADAIFEPSNEHLIAMPVLIYKAHIALFGLDDQLPFRLTLAAAFVALGVVVFLFVRERVGEVIGLAAAALVLFMGPAWEDLLWSFQVGFVGSLASGIGALLALERRDRRGDLCACLLLILALSFSDLGVPFVLGAFVAVLVRRRPLELWIALVPGALFALWWLLYGQHATSHLSAHNLVRLPGYVVKAPLSGIVSVSGLHAAASLIGDALGIHVDADSAEPLLLLAIPIGLALAVMIVRLLRRGWRPSPELLAIATVALSFWALTGANYLPGREPAASRYQLISGTLLILAAAELARSRPPRRLAQRAVALAACVAVGLNVYFLTHGFDVMRRHATLAKADLGALEIGRGQVPDGYGLLESVTHDNALAGVTAGAFYRETDAHGSPADSPREIATAPLYARSSADNVLAAGYGFGLDPAPVAGARQAGCDRAGVGASGEARLPFRAVRIVNAGRSKATIGVRRFASPQALVILGAVARHSAIWLRIPPDRVAVPWHLQTIEGPAVRVCRPG